MSVQPYKTEATLVAALRKGDLKAYEHLYGEARPLIIHLATFNRGAATDGTDLLQEAMIVLLRNLQKPDFVLTCSVKTYLYAVCRNKWFSYLQRKKLDHFDIAEYPDIPDDTPDPESWAADQQVKEAINGLDEVCRKLLLYFYFEGLSLEQISVKLGLGNANVAKVRRFRCMERLKEKAKNLLSR